MDSVKEKKPEIPGFRLLTDYIIPQEEKYLMQQADSGPWQTEFRRRIQQYGLGYSGDLGRKPTWVRDLPEWLLPLAARVAKDAPLPRFPENCVINEYNPPIGIGPHRDYQDFGDTIACVSLGSDIVMDFAQPERGLKHGIYVQARSFWVMTGAARWEWTHGIAARLTDMIAGERRRRNRRISITFRTAR